VLTGRGALTPRESISVLEPVLGALAAAHRAGIVHGDVKPENVILTDDGRIKVADFGLARAITAPITATASGELLGTVAYLAPNWSAAGCGRSRGRVFGRDHALRTAHGKQPSLATTRCRWLTGTSTNWCQRRPRCHPSCLPPSTMSRCGPPVAIPIGGPPNAGALLSDLHAAMSEVPDAQLDIRAADPAALRLDAAATAVPAMPAAPTAASGPQPTRVLAVPRRPTRSAVPLLPRLKVHEDEPEAAGFPGDRRRQGLAAIGGAVVVVLLIFTGIWWFANGPGSYLPTPSLAGQRQSDAQRILSTQGLRNEVRPVFNAKVAAGQVISTNPAGGQHVKKNGLVVLSVSKGPQLIAVPDVSGMTVPDATAALQVPT